jgi:periplasmic protein TonB
MTGRFGVAAFSFTAHIALGTSLVVLSVLSADTLPTPRSVLAFHSVERVVQLPQDIELPPQRPFATPASSSSPTPYLAPTVAAPVVAPEGIQPETTLNHTAADVRGRTGVDGVEAGAFGFGDGLGVTEPPPPLAPTQPVRLRAGMTAPRKVHDVALAYPARARAARAEGLVVLEAIIDVEGRVVSLRVLRPVPLLTEAALDAVRQWRYEPAWLNGQPVPVVMTVTINFTLNQ